MKGSRAKMADARVDAYTKCVSNILSVSHVNSAWKSANCTSLDRISWELKWPAPERTRVPLSSYMHGKRLAGLNAKTTFTQGGRVRAPKEGCIRGRV